MNDFLSKLYEIFGLGYVEGFSDDLYDSGVYFDAALYSVLIALCSIAIMYHVYFRWLRTTNSPITWFFWVFATCIICGVTAYTIAHGALFDIYAEQNQDLPYSFGNFLKFAIINALWVFVLFWIFSVLIKGWSPHGKATPHLWPTKKTKTKRDIK
jgi:hypothetical protein